MEPGIVHAERFEDAILEEIVQRLARRDLHDATEDIGGHAVDPAVTGIVDERE